MCQHPLPERGHLCGGHQSVQVHLSAELEWSSLSAPDTDRFVCKTCQEGGMLCLIQSVPMCVCCADCPVICPVVILSLCLFVCVIMCLHVTQSKHAFVSVLCVCVCVCVCVCGCCAVPVSNLHSLFPQQEGRVI